MDGRDVADRAWFDLEVAPPLLDRVRHCHSIVARDSRGRFVRNVRFLAGLLPVRLFKARLRPETNDLVATFIISRQFAGFAILELRDGLDPAVRQNVLPHGQRAFLLIHAIALDDARALELALILLLTVGSTGALLQ